MKAIQKELGRKDEKGNEVDDLKKKIERAKCRPRSKRRPSRSSSARGHAAMSAEATVSRNYLDWLWRAVAQEVEGEPRPEAARASPRRPLRLEKVKERILEFLAVRALVKKRRPRF